MKKYKEIAIDTHSAGFGMYQAGEANGDAWECINDLLQDMRDHCGSELYELGVDALPQGAKDIRGRIYNEPARVFAFIEDGEAYYCGIIAVDADDEEKVGE